MNRDVFTNRLNISRFMWMILFQLIWKLFRHEWNVLSDFSQKVMGMIVGFSFNEKSLDTHFVHLA